MEIGKFRTDPKKEIEGVEVPIGDGLIIKVARTGNAKANKLYEELTKDPQHRLAVRAGSVDPEFAEKVVVEVLGEAILLGWKGLTDNGVPIPYSKEKAKEYLRIKDFRDLVQRAAESQELFRADLLESSAKN